MGSLSCQFIDATWCMTLLLFQMCIFQCPFSSALKLDVQKLHFIKIAIFSMNAQKKMFFRNVGVWVCFVFNDDFNGQRQLSTMNYIKFVMFL